MDSENLSDIDFQQQLLNEVSRSFAFTIPQLPETLRRVISNAYLLCRIADTIEDENHLTYDQKKFFWFELTSIVSDSKSPEKFSKDLLSILPSTNSTSEKNLIRNFNRIISINRRLSEIERERIKRCLNIMCEGMKTFQKKKNPQGLKSLTDFNEYCYYVAGVVGELLTDLFCDYSIEISRNRAILKKLAVSFGQSLQMTNILKDLWKDLDRGICWLPTDIFQKDGFDLNNLSKKKYYEGFAKGIFELITIANSHLKNALTFSLLIPKKEKGLRKFCLWAIGMAIFTLKKINGKRFFIMREEAKISRRIVKGIIFITNLTLGHNILLKILFFIFTRGFTKQCSGGSSKTLSF